MADTLAEWFDQCIVKDETAEVLSVELYAGRWSGRTLRYFPKGAEISLPEMERFLKSRGVRSKGWINKRWLGIRHYGD